MVRLTDCPAMTLDVYRRRKTAIQQQLQPLTVSSTLGMATYILHMTHFLIMLYLPMKFIRFGSVVNVIAETRLDF